MLIPGRYILILCRVCDWGMLQQWRLVRSVRFHVRISRVHTVVGMKYISVENKKIIKHRRVGPDSLVLSLVGGPEQVVVWSR